MKILNIFYKNPYPPVGGAEIVTYNTVKYLAKLGHEITLISVVNKKEKTPELEKFCNWEPVEGKSATSTFRRLVHLPHKTPYVISNYHSPKIKDKIRKVLEETNFDLVHIETLYPARYSLFIKKETQLPVVLREHNFETALFKTFYQNEENSLFKIYRFLQYLKLSRYEAKFSRLCDRCIMITREDKNRLKEMIPSTNTSVVPAGVDTSYFSPIDRKAESKSLVFVGSMNWPPNIKGMVWFTEKILPKVKEEFPQVKLYIVGKSPPPKIRRLEDKNTVVTGYVDDVRDYMARGQVSIVPLKTGSGMRIKILNAMAMAKPVVSTSIGCEGIHVTDGRDILIGDTPEEFANQTLTLLQNEKKRKEIAKAGLNLVKENYRWETVTKKLVSKYRKVIRDQDD